MIYPILATLSEGMVLFLNLYSWLIVISATLTLFTRPKDKPSKVKLTLKNMTDPVNNIFRGFFRKVGGAPMPVDISPMISLIFIWVVSGLLTQLAKYFYGLTY